MNRTQESNAVQRQNLGGLFLNPFKKFAKKIEEAVKPLAKKVADATAHAMNTAEAPKVDVEAAARTVLGKAKDAVTSVSFLTGGSTRVTTEKSVKTQQQNKTL